MMTKASGGGHFYKELINGDIGGMGSALALQVVYLEHKAALIPRVQWLHTWANPKQF